MSASPGHLLRILVVTFIAWAMPTASFAQDDAASRRAAIDMMYPIMINALETKNYGRARNICDQVIMWEPQNPLHHYNLACIEAQTGGTRLPYAMGELDLAIALGFDDVEHLKSDPDLQPLHSDPRFAVLVRKATYYATADAALDAISIPSPSAKLAASAAPPETEKPAPASFDQGRPVGLYFMTRYRAATRAIENLAWYFAPDGAVYQNLQDGFSAPDLAAHPGPKGRAEVQSDKLGVTWSDGKKITAADVERDGTGFLWDMGIFVAATPFDDVSDVAGSYDSGDSLPLAGNKPAAVNRLELRADGTYEWTGIAFAGKPSQNGVLTANDNDTSKGRWQLSGYSLILTDDKGARLRRMALPLDDEKTVVKPDRMFFAGLVFRRQL